MSCLASPSEGCPMGELWRVAFHAGVTAVDVLELGADRRRGSGQLDGQSANMSSRATL
jgi:hypothetical protein